MGALAAVRLRAGGHQRGVAGLCVSAVLLLGGRPWCWLGGSADCAVEWVVGRGIGWESQWGVAMAEARTPGGTVIRNKPIMIFLHPNTEQYVADTPVGVLLRVL